MDCSFAIENNRRERARIEVRKLGSVFKQAHDITQRLHMHNYTGAVQRLAYTGASVKRVLP